MSLTCADSVIILTEPYFFLVYQEAKSYLLDSVLLSPIPGPVILKVSPNLHLLMFLHLSLHLSHVRPLVMQLTFGSFLSGQPITYSSNLLLFQASHQEFFSGQLRPTDARLLVMQHSLGRFPPRHSITQTTNQH